VIVNLAVHGGSYHKVVEFAHQLIERGISARLLISVSPRLGLQLGVDIDEDDRETLESAGVLVATYEEIRRYVEQVRARLYVFDGSKSARIGSLIDLVRTRHRAKTAQICSMYHEFIYWGSDYVFLQHPLSLWFIRDVYRWPGWQRLRSARRIEFVGNIYAEPVCNTLTSTIRTKSGLCRKYGLDADKPVCLWLPDRHDGNRPVYPAVVNAVKSASYNLLVKPHPWEYKNIKHGFDPRYGEGVTSAEKYGCEAVEERDSSWCLRFSDMVVIGTSTIGIEMPYWRKPFIYINSGSWRNRVVESCCVWLRSPDQITGVFAQGGVPQFSENDYLDALHYLHPDPVRDSFTLHCDATCRALEDPGTGGAIGSNRAIQSLYRNIVPSSWKGDASTLFSRAKERFRQNAVARTCFDLVRGRNRNP